MKFELDEILIDDILFHMENQMGSFLLDCRECYVVNTDNPEFEAAEDIDYTDTERFIALPEWGPQDGFRLMEKFTATLKNPVARFELSEALNQKKGVFRAFKRTIEQYPEVESIWFSYKEHKMKNVVINWYNSLREEWGLEPLGIEHEDTSMLILEDFVFKTSIETESEILVIAENSEGEEVGCINTKINENDCQIIKLEVKPEYRGLGLGTALLSKQLEMSIVKGKTITIDIPQKSHFFARILYQEGFKLDMQRFSR